jgi:large subunit ribosomal protein L22
MDVTAITRYARMSPLKARDLAQRVQGLPVSEALKVTEFSERKAAALIGKTLKSAIANAENTAKLSVDKLRVKEAVVEDGPRMRRFWPRSRGMASPILKRMCHIRVVLTDDGASAPEPKPE